MILTPILRSISMISMSQKIQMTLIMKILRLTMIHFTGLHLKVDGRQGGHKEPTITYTLQGRPSLMSVLSDPHYFTGAFPTLFPYGIGGHLDKRDIAVGLEAFARWSMNHHSRRYSRLWNSCCAVHLHLVTITGSLHIDTICT